MSSASNDTEAWNRFLSAAPYTQHLGVQLGSLDAGGCVLTLPFREDFIGDPDTGVVHGGVITALFDIAFGVAIYYRTQVYTPMATLDLRVDYLRPAAPGQRLLASARCYKLTTELAFVQGLAYENDPGDPFANGTGIFMFTEGRPAFAPDPQR